MSYLTKDLKQYPNALMDYIIKVMCLNNDADLAELLGIHQSTISRLRNQTPMLSGLKHKIADTHILAIYDATGLPIEEIRSILYQQKFYKQMPAPYAVVQERLAAEEADRLAKQQAFRNKLSLRV